MLSLIIPTNNRALILKKLLLELKKQEGIFEVIVIDDASLDNTKEMVINCAKNLNYNLIYIKLKYQVGLPSARNVGLSQSSYKIIGYLDDDCLPLCKDLFKRAYYWLTQDEQKVIGVGGPVYSRSNKPNLNKFKLNLRNFYNFLELFYYKRLNLAYVNSIPGGNCFFRKDLVKKCGGFDPNFGGNYYREETDLCMRISKFGKLVSDPKMPVNHLQINYGGCRKEYSEFYSNVFENTILLIMKNKRLTIEVFLDTYKHFLGFIYSFTSGSRKRLIKTSRSKLLFSMLHGICKGFKKSFRKREKDSYNIEEKLKFNKSIKH